MRPPRQLLLLRKTPMVLLLSFLFLLVFLSNAASSSKQHRSSSSSCLYKTLGASRGCSQDELKKSYRKACLKHHPDKGGDEDKFKEVTRAYEVLSDPEKRDMYDRYGEAGIGNGAGAPGAGFGGFGNSGNQQQGGTAFYGNVPPNAFFGSGNGAGAGGFGGAFPGFFSSSSQTFGGGGAGGGTKRRSSRSSSSSSFAFGSDGDRDYSGGGPSSFFRRASRPSTNGDGGLDLDLEELLNQMLGRQGSHSRGRQQQQQQYGFPYGTSSRQQQQQQSSSFERRVPCSLEELATGCTKKLKVKNHGQSRIYEFHIKPGWKAGTKIKFKASATMPAMTFIIEEKKHPHFERRGDDIIYRHKLRGDGLLIQGPEQLEVTLLDGSIWSRTIPTSRRSSLLKPGRTLTVPDQGMPIKGGPERGNLIIEFY